MRFHSELCVAECTEVLTSQLGTRRGIAADSKASQIPCHRKKIF